ncbi:MAG: GntR family transcriptional regulator [Desulfobacterales bacterium]|nr:GntR family transcriptional regulator [Desulfobacterales bacterium]
MKFKTSIDLPDNKSIAMRIYEGLRNAIIRGELKPGERIIESDLGNMFNVSRSPIRDALRMLALDGFAEIIPYRGTIISSIHEKDLKEHFEIKGMVEGFSAWIGAKRFEEAELLELEAVLDQIETYKKKDDLHGVLECNFLFHRAVVDKVGNTKLSKYYDSLAQSIRRYGTIGLTDRTKWGITCQEHREIFEAIKKRQPAIAEEKSRRHALNSMERILRALREKKREVPQEVLTQLKGGPDEA